MEDIKIGAENRKFSRMDFRRPVKCRLQEGALPFGELSQDLSEGGLRMRSSRFLPVNSSVMVQVKLTDSSEILDLESRVAWIRYQPYSEYYQIGLEFKGAPAECRSRIASHMAAV